MIRSFSLCNGAGLDCCDTCQRWCENQPEASKDPKQGWIPEATTDHCAYWMPSHRIDLNRGFPR